MRQTILALAVLLAAVGNAGADPASDGIQATISAQIKAFRDGDYAGAFDFASDDIRQIFGTPENFGAMVERGYAMVIAPAQIQYSELRVDGDALWQRVLILDRNGTWHALDYRMIEADGVWRISGVELLEAPGVGA